MKRETYKAAQERLLEELSSRGWTRSGATVRPRIDDVGHETTSLWFHPQAVYIAIASGGRPKASDSRSLNIDIRGMSYQDFGAEILRHKKWCSG